MKKVSSIGMPTERRRPHGTIPAREIAVRCVYFGALAVFTVVLWVGAISLVQFAGLIMRAGLR